MVVDASSVQAQFVPQPHNPFPHGISSDPGGVEVGPEPEFDFSVSLLVLIGMIDALMRDVMDRSGARSLQLFIAQDGKGVLSRAYTNAEYNFMMTQVDHKFPIGRVTKGLTGMRFVKQKVLSDGTFEHRLSGLRNWTLREAARVSEMQMTAKFLNDATNAYRFDQTTVEHLLRHEAGWDQYYDWTGKADALADHVPLDAGDTVPVLRYQTDALYVADPGVKKGDYSNPAYWLLGEILSLELTNGVDAGQYRPIMREFWGHADLEDISASVVIPFERDESFARGLIPMITSFPAASPRPAPGDAENAASYPWRPNAWCEPHGLVLAGGHWAMSMKDLARIFEGMAPTPGPHAPKLLETWQVEVLAGRPLAGLQTTATFGMGMAAWRYTAPDTGSGAGAATYDVLGLGGGVTAGGCYAAQFRLRTGTGPGTITIAMAATTDFPSTTLDQLYAVLNIVRTINHLAYWDGAPDLFA